MFELMRVQWCLMRRLVHLFALPMHCLNQLCNHNAARNAEADVRFQSMLFGANS